MRLHTKIIAAVLMLMAGIGAGVAMQPTHFWNADSVAISAPLESVFDKVNTVENWQSWWHWAADPAVKVSLEGSPSGKGSIFQWAGNDAVSAGSAEIVESKPGDRIELSVVCVKPTASSSRIELTFRPEGNRTRLEWTLTGRRSFAEKVRQAFSDDDGNGQARHFRRSLADLKRVAEENAQP